MDHLAGDGSVRAPHCSIRTTAPGIPGAGSGVVTASDHGRHDGEVPDGDDRRPQHFRPGGRRRTEPYARRLAWVSVLIGDVPLADSTSGRPVASAGAGLS